MNTCIRTIILLILLTIFVSACSITSFTPPNFQASESNQQELVEIVWYVRTSESEQPWEQEIVKNFQLKHPNIKVNLVIVPNSDFDTKLQTLVAAGTPPDVFSHWGSTGFGDFYKRGLVADLTPFIQKENYDLSDFIPEVLDVYTIDDKIMGLPMLATGTFVFYNKDLFDSAGIEYPPTSWDDTSWTWEKFVEICGQLTVANDNPTDVIFGCNLELWPLDAYLWIFGERLFSERAYETGFADEAFLDSQEMLKPFQAWQDLMWKYGYMPDPAVADAVGGGSVFKSGRVAMTLTGGWGWWNYVGLESEFNWGVAALPFGSSNRRSVIYTDPWLMSKQSKHPDVAWEFIKYLVSPEVQASWVELIGAPPSRNSLMEDWFNRSKTMSAEDVREVHLGSLKYGYTCACDQLVRFDQIDQVIYSALDPILHNEATPGEVLQEADKKLEETLKQIENQYSN